MRMVNGKRHPRSFPLGAAAPLVLLIVLSAVARAAQEPPAVAGVNDAPSLRCAVLVVGEGGGLGSSPLTELLEVELAGRGGLTLVERGAIREVLGEQQLAEAMGAGQTARRAALGRLLRADLLVLLRPGEGGEALPDAAGAG